MSFSPVRNVRIRSLTAGALVQLRLGKAAVKSPGDVVVEAKLLRHEEVGDRSLMVFEETHADGQKSELTISRFPGAPWRADTRYVSLIAVDESTFTVRPAASPILTDAIGKAVELVTKEAEDVYGAEQLIALLNKIRDGRRVPTDIKALATQYANKLVDELSALQEPEPALAS